VSIRPGRDGREDDDVTVLVGGVEGAMEPLLRPEEA
jgi:hypothetical protein